MGTLISFAFADGGLQSPVGSGWDDHRNRDWGNRYPYLYTGAGHEMYVGWWDALGTYQSFMKFDTSPLAQVKDVIRTGRINTRLTTSYLMGGFSIRARVLDWETVLLGDFWWPDVYAFVPAYELESLPILNTASSMNGFWTMPAGADQHINRTGVTSVMVHSNDQLLATQPYDSNNYQGCRRITYSDATQHPYFEVQYGGLVGASVVTGVGESVFVSPSTQKRFFLGQQAGTYKLGAWIHEGDQ